MKPLETAASFAITGIVSVFMATGVAAASGNASSKPILDLTYGSKVVLRTTAPVTVAGTDPYVVSITKKGLIIEPPVQAGIKTETFLDNVPFSQTEDYYTAAVTVIGQSAKRQLRILANSQQCIASEGDLAAKCTAEAVAMPNAPQTPKSLAKVTVPWESLVVGPGPETIALEITPSSGGISKTAPVHASIDIVVNDTANTRGYITVSKTYKTGHSTVAGAVDTFERISGDAVSPLSVHGRIVTTVNQDTGEFEGQFAKTLKALPAVHGQAQKCGTCVSPQADDAASKAFHLPQPSEALAAKPLADAGTDFLPFDWKRIKNLDAGLQYVDQVGPFSVALGGLSSSSISDGIISLSTVWGAGNANQLFFTNIAATHNDKSGHNAQTGLALSLSTRDGRIPEVVNGSYSRTSGKFFGKYVASNQYRGVDAFFGVRAEHKLMTALRHAFNGFVVAAYRSTGTGYLPSDGSTNELTGIAGPVAEAGLTFSANSALHDNFAVTLGGYDLSNPLTGQRASLTSGSVSVAISKVFSLEYDADTGQITGGLIKNGGLSTTLYPRFLDKRSVGYDDGTYHFSVGWERALNPSCTAIPAVVSCTSGDVKTHLTFEAATVQAKAITFGVSYGGLYGDKNTSAGRPLQELAYAGYKFGGCNGLYASFSNTRSEDPTPVPGSTANVFLELNQMPFVQLGTFYIGYNNVTGIMQAPGTATVPVGTPTRDHSTYFKLRLGTREYHKAICG